MATSPTEGGDRRTAQLSELIRSLFTDVALLARREGELAMIELKEKASKVGVAVGLLAAAVVLGVFALATLIAAAVLALAIVLPAWAAALIVTAVLLAVAATLALIARARLRAATPLAPTRTIETVQEDIGWIRHETEQLTTTE
jgi:uncharacterized membrane protein YqjE